MNDVRTTILISTHSAVNDFPFGANPGDLFNLSGQPDNAAQNYTGELEVLYGDVIYRFFENRFVECTFPDAYHFVIDGIAVLSVFDWLKGQADAVDKARFRISLQNGIAYDFRNPVNGSITIFEQGRWDALLKNY